ncbi:hypothetical protein LLH23_13585 [bacterium]|nr:hypothetical protein [bacterium]
MRYLALLVALAVVTPALALDFRDDFSSRRPGWELPSGDWQWQDGALLQQRATDIYTYAVREEQLTEGVITVEATATDRNSSGDGCFGLMCKFLDDRNWVAVRFGAYGQTALLMRVDGEKRITGLRPFACEPGRSYRGSVTITRGLLLVELDGKPVGVSRDPFAGRAGRPGVYAQSPARFHLLTVSDAPALPDTTPAAQAALQAGPQVRQASAVWSVEAVEYAVAPLSPTISGPDRCSLALYVRNRSQAPAAITDLALDGVPAATLREQGRLAWWRAWPQTVPPGAVAQVLVKFSSLSLAHAAQVVLGAPVGPMCLRLEGDGGPLEVIFALSPQPPPLCVNFIAFDDALQTLDTYVAASGKLVGRPLERVAVNGQEVTARLQPDVKTLGGLRADTLPLHVKLPQPLTPGAPTVVTVRAGGVTAGHAVRAFPSRFPVQLVILGRQPGPAEVAEIAGLCFSEVGFCGAKWENLPELARHGLRYFPYAYPDAKTLDAYLGRPAARAPLVGWWIDEIDGWKKTPEDARQMLVAADALMADKGLPLAPYCMNIMAPWADIGYVELADALSHEYGIDFGIPDSEGFRRALDFQTPGDISRRELRTARRPFWPYFRNLEAAVLLDPQTKQVVGQYRPLDPREHRLLVYSCLADGAKGALNWNYGVNYLKPPSWLSKQYDAIRLNMTAQKDPQAFGVTIPPELLEGLRAATAECGRVNAELQLLGPLLAMGDVSDLASVTRCTPEHNPRGGPAAHARAIVCGPETLVLLVVNLNIDSNFNARQPQPVKSYEAADVTVEVALPQWLQVSDVFSVSCRGIQAQEAERSGRVIRLRFPSLAVSGAVVLTADRSLRPRLSRELPVWQAKLRAAGYDVR